MLITIATLFILLLVINMDKRASFSLVHMDRFVKLEKEIKLQEETFLASKSAHYP